MGWDSVGAWMRYLGVDMVGVGPEHGDDGWCTELAEWRGRGHGVNERKHRDSQRELRRIGLDLLSNKR